MLDIARPLLYRKIEIVIEGRLHRWRDRGLAARRFGISRRSLPLLRKLGIARLKRLVRSVVISQVYTNKDAEQGDVGWIMPCVKRVLEVLPKLETITLVHPPGLEDVDYSIHHSQTRRSHFPVIHLVLPEWDFGEMEYLEGAYASLELHDLAITLESPFFNVLPNMTSLRVHCSRYFSQRLSLASLDNLEYLEFIAERQFVRNRDPDTYSRPIKSPDRLEALLDEFQQLSSLKTLVFSGSPCSTLNKLLLPPHGLIAHTPPYVSKLIIDVDIGADKLCKVIGSLPSSTGIKVMGIRVGKDELKKVEGECRKKGIKLTSV